MKNLRGKTAILTGANGGLGRFIAESLAREGVNLFLVGAEATGMAEVAQFVTLHGVQVETLVADLRQVSEQIRVLEEADRKFGAVEILINNAGVEYSVPFEKLTEAQLEQVLDVNLHVPMHLSRRLLPGLLRRGSGHIVNLSSLAGRSGPACQEPYAASKAGLTAFTFSLRATCRGTGVSASVVTPGFVDAGIYARLKDRTGCAAPFFLGAVPPQRVAAAVVRAIRRDRPEIIVSKFPVRPVLMLMDLAPSLGLAVISWLGAHRYFRAVVAADEGRNGGAS
jgi:short-subunit dehydrogenase